MATKKKAPKVSNGISNDYDNRTRISFYEGELPKVCKDLAVGEKCDMSISVQMVGEVIEEWGEKKGKKRYTFAVNNIKK
jgi:hypothetical protein